MTYTHGNELQARPWRSMHLKSFFCVGWHFSPNVWYSYAFAKYPLALQLNMCRELTGMSSDMISVVVSLWWGEESGFNDSQLTFC